MNIIITWWAVWLVGIILYKSIGAATARQTLKSQCNDWWDFPGRVIFSEWKNIHNLKPGRCDRLSLGMGTCVKKKVAKICSTYNQKVLKKETFSSSRRAKRHIRVETNWFQMPLSSPNWEYCGPWSTLGFCSKNDHFDPCCPIFVLWCIKENLRISYWNFPSVRSLMQSAWRRFLNRTIRRFWEKNFWMCGTWQCYIRGLYVYLRPPEFVLYSRNWGFGKTVTFHVFEVM